MSLLFRSRLVFGLAVLMGTSWLHAADVEGRVVDEDSRRPLEGVQVEVSTLPGQKAVTDAQGRYRLVGVVAGPAVVKASFIGYTEAERTLDVASRTSQLDLMLRSGLRDLGAARVQGQAGGQVKALNDQRNASDIRNVIASDQIGRFPDQNAAEAIARAPGVSVARDQGEGRYVLVRGTEPGLTSVKINGQDVPSPEGDIRAVALDVIPSGQVGSIELFRLYGRALLWWAGHGQRRLFLQVD